MVNFKDIKILLESRGQDASEYEASYIELTSRIKESISARTPDDLGEARSIREFSLVLRQILLHRAIRLFEGALNALLDGNVYLMVLAIRGHFETSAAVGYLHSRLNSLQKQTVDSKIVHKDILDQIMGTKEKGLLDKAQQMGVDAKQVLKLFKYADRSVSKLVLKDPAGKHVILTDCYEYLCEFCHPNFHSNSVAFELNREQGKFLFLHDKRIRDREFNLIGHLLLSNPLFINLFDQLDELLPRP